MVPQPEPEFPADVKGSKTFGQALAGVINRGFLASQRWQEQQWRADRHGLHPDLAEFERVFIRKMSQLGVPVFTHEGVRSPARQDDMFALGTSRAKGGQSAHQFGCAVDIVHSTKAWALEPKQWALMGHVGKEIIAQKGLAIHSLAWGGDWTFYDPAHWEVKDWRNIKGGYPWLT